MKDVDILKQCYHVKYVKPKDVNNLIKFFTLPNDAQKFNKDIIKPLPNKDNEDVINKNEAKNLY